MKIFFAVLTLILFSGPLPATAGGEITREMLQQGNDIDSLRCDDRIIMIGDSSRDVISKCGEPVRKTRMLHDPFPVWIYRFSSSGSIFYLAFSDGDLHRMVEAQCWADNPDCK